MAKNPAISLRSRWLSERLKAARLRAGYTLFEAGEFVQLDHSTLSRFERGTHRIRRSYVRDLVDFYGVASQREREYLVRLAEDAWRKDWWDGESTDLEMGFIDLTWLESRATKICIFEPLVIHGLLQTPEYALALSRVGLSGVDVETANRAAETRTARQRILSGDDPTHLSVVVEEPALRRVIGNKKVAREQLRHLLSVNQRSHIDIRLLSTDAPWDPGLAGPFAHFEMPDPYPEIAYVENLAGRAFVEDDQKVARFGQTYDELQRLSLSPTRTTAFLRHVLKDLE